MYRAGAATVPIADGGVSRAVVVVDDAAPVYEKHAAAELTNFLHQVTGATFVLTNTSASATNRLLVGPTAARLADPGFTTNGLGPDGIVIRTVTNDLILAGGRPRGTLYAVFTFLEDDVGCRWWTSTESTIPSRPTLAAAETDRTYVPVFEYRDVYWKDALGDPNGDWGVRNKCNGTGYALDATRGGKRSYCSGLGVHTFYTLIPPASYSGPHPEWFTWNGTSRVWADYRDQLCLSNEAMRKQLVTNLLARLAADPDASLASVSQNDCFYGYGYCQCSNCAAIDAAEGAQSGSILRFVNKVADDIRDAYPNVTLSTLAYQYSQAPPALEVPRSNVTVRLCSMSCSFATPLDDPGNDRNSAFHNDLNGWAALAPHSEHGLYIWDYTANFRHYFVPHPNLRVLAPNVKFFAEHEVKGVFEQGAYTTYGTEMAALRAWMLAKLLWNPDVNGTNLIAEFTDGYFGPAGEPIRRYIDVIHDSVEAQGSNYRLNPHKWWYDARDEYLSWEVVRDGWAHLRAAQQAVRDDPVLLRRVEVAQLPVLYMVMKCWDTWRTAAAANGDTWPFSGAIENVYDHFMEVAAANNIQTLSEFAWGFSELDADLALYAEPRGSIDVRVVDFNGNPIPGAKVKLWGLGNLGWPDTVGEKTADANGAVSWQPNEIVTGGRTEFHFNLTARTTNDLGAWQSTVLWEDTNAYWHQYIPYTTNDYRREWTVPTPQTASNALGALSADWYGPDATLTYSGLGFIGAPSNAARFVRHGVHFAKFHPYTGSFNPDGMTKPEFPLGDWTQLGYGWTTLTNHGAGHKTLRVTNDLGYSELVLSYPGNGDHHMYYLDTVSPLTTGRYEAASGQYVVAFDPRRVLADAVYGNQFGIYWPHPFDPPHDRPLEYDTSYFADLRLCLDGPEPFEPYETHVDGGEHPTLLTVIVRPGNDRDADGMDDAWEILHFGATNAPGGEATNDWDGDGSCNLYECGAGTHPKLASSVFGISNVVCAGGSNVVVYWTSVSNKFYSIRGTTNLLDGFPAVLDHGVPADPPVNARTLTVDEAGSVFLQLRLER